MNCWFAILLVSIYQVDAFSQNGVAASLQKQARTALAMSAETAASSINTLTTDTTWRLRLLLNDVTTTKGRKLDGQLFVVEGNFIEEEGYEPPQGLFQPSAKQTEGEEEGDASGMSLEVTNSRWKLSEDPDDRKDGLWIWGLFKEPLYPFMLLQMETKELNLASDDDDTLPPLKLYAQINHIRDQETGNVELQTANLNVRILEQIQLPGAKLDLFEEEAVGQVSFQPL